VFFVLLLVSVAVIVAGVFVHIMAYFLDNRGLGGGGLRPRVVLVVVRLSRVADTTTSPERPRWPAGEQVDC
jgi:hypothetical protein